jgi:Flp pilus assembly protein protease CpaA
MYDGPWFYPDPIFGWTFYAVLLGFLAVATYIDIGTLRIPKTLTVPMLGVGLVFSLVRGIWMGSLVEGTGWHVWMFASSPALGALDGLLCALAGFAASFALFFVLWRVGFMRGGDVKLVAALGAWLGPVIVMLVVLGTIPVFLVLGTFLLMRKMFRRGFQKTVFNIKHAARGDNLKKTKAGTRRREVLLAYSLPVALSAGVLLALVAWHDQGHPVPHKDSPPSEQASAQP